VPGTCDIDDIRIMLFDQAIEMDIDEVLPRRSSPVPEQSWFDLLRSERLSQQGVFEEVDLADAQVIRGSPVAIHLVEHFWREWALGSRGFYFTMAIGRNSSRQGHIEDKLRGLRSPI
jgi:hypothetical protein